MGRGAAIASRSSSAYCGEMWAGRRLPLQRRRLCDSRRGFLRSAARSSQGTASALFAEGQRQIPNASHPSLSVCFAIRLARRTAVRKGRGGADRVAMISRHRFRAFRSAKTLSRVATREASGWRGDSFASQIDGKCTGRGGCSRAPASRDAAAATLLAVCGRKRLGKDRVAIISRVLLRRTLARRTAVQ